MLSILLVQHALAPGITEANMRSRLPGNPRGQPAGSEAFPYLKITGALALRFSAPPPPPDLTTKPAASAPPFPVPGTAAIAAPVATPVPVEAAAKPAEPTASPVTQPAPVTDNPPPTILPDDTRPTTRPEDFLPFFQFPGSTGDVSVPATITRPASPGQLPPSSATYQQR